MTIIRLSYDIYVDLYFHEHTAITEFMNNNPIPLAEILKSENAISQGMRAFIVDYITGKVKRKRGQRGNTIDRDYKIYLEIDELLALDNGFNLTSNSATSGAGALVCDKYNVSEDVAIKAYQRIDKAIKDSETN